MDDKTYNVRQSAAAKRLKKIGEYGNAQAWIRRHREDYEKSASSMTPLEYAELEMPVGWFGAILRALGLF